MSENELEFLKVHDDFRPRILRYMTRLVGRLEAEDLTQDVFIKVMNSLKSFRGESQLSTWLYRIATNTALDRLRNSSYKQMVQEVFPLEPLVQIETGIGSKNKWADVKSALPDAELIRKEMNDCIRAFIEQLPADYRIVMVLSELEGMKNIQIAEVLGITLETVKIRLHRARAKLKKELEANCSFYRNERNELACDLKTAFEELRSED